MSEQPRVLAVMLVSGRQAMVERAVKSFRQQTYPAKHLAILDTGPEPMIQTFKLDGQISLTRMPLTQPRSIGHLRNLANLLATSGALDAPLIAHFDSDDYSHPERLTEQVAFLEAGGADCAGYREMLFWDQRPIQFAGAWIYSSPNPAYCIGTSLLYTRKIWERFPFPERHTGEDTVWLHEKRIQRVACSSVGSLQPSMIASIHGANTSSEIQPGAREWRRVPEWDSYCRGKMKL